MRILIRVNTVILEHWLLLLEHIYKAYPGTEIRASYDGRLELTIPPTEPADSYIDFFNRLFHEENLITGWYRFPDKGTPS